MSERSPQEQELGETPVTLAPDPVTVERIRFARPVDDPPATPGESEEHGPLDDEPITGRSPRTTAPTSQARQREIEKGMGRALVGALTVVWIAARWALRARQRDLRRPTPEEYSGVADPIGRILARHAPVEFAPDLIMDIMDGSEAAGALVLYLDPPQPPKEIRTS